jgi:transcriptional regulator with XRE-family HTH domain
VNGYDFSSTITKKHTTSHHISGKFLCVENLTSQIGLQIRTARKSKGITQREVSQKTGLDQAYMSCLENSTAEGSPAQMLSIARAIGVSIAQLYDEQVKQKPVIIANANFHRDLDTNKLPTSEQVPNYLDEAPSDWGRFSKLLSDMLPNE